MMICVKCKNLEIIMASCRKDDHQMLFSAESSHYQPVHRHLHYHPHPLQTDKEGYTSNKITSSLQEIDAD